MKNTIIVALLGLASLAAVACSPAESNVHPASATSTSASAPLLDGRTFSVDSAKLPDGSVYASDLSFANGILTSSACSKIGYAPGRYTATREGDVIAFRAEMKKGNETEVWTGRIRGDAIDASVTNESGQTLAWMGRSKSN